MPTIERLKCGATIGLVLASLIINQLPVDGQTRRVSARRQPQGRTQQPQPPTENAIDRTSDSANRKQVVLSSSKKGEKMASPFETGKLPEPLRKPQGSIDQAAATLAKQVSARDDQSVSALLTAIMAAGFSVRDKDGSVTQTVEPGQGLVFDAWEVAAMAKMYGENKTVLLTYLTEGFKSIPELKQTPLETILFNGIRTHAQRDEPLLRFWARFIIELGRHANEPYDMLGAADAKSVRLDAIQVALILRRLYGDFYGLAQRGEKTWRGAGEEKTRPNRPAMVAGGRGTSREEGSTMRVKSFAHVVKAHATTITTAEPAQGDDPCKGVGSDTVHDAQATGRTTAWDALLGDTKMGGAVNIANILLAYAKFIATYAALKTEITVANPPLVRTQNNIAGENRQLTAKVTMEVGAWEKINCFRPILNFFTGLDFGLLDNGPLAGVEVNWNLSLGGDKDNNQFVGFWTGAPRIQDAGTYAGIPGGGGIAVGNLTRSKTNKDGIAQVYLQGRPRPWHPPYFPVMKQAVVYTTIKMKGGDIKGDAVDLAGQVSGGLGGLVLTLPLELLYRTDWASTASIIVPVKDWETCEGQWFGTMTTSTHAESNSTEYVGEDVMKHQSTYNFFANINVNGAKATATMHLEESYSYDHDSGSIAGRITHQDNASAEYSGDVFAGVDLHPNGKYAVSFARPSMRGTSRSTGSCERPLTGCDQPVPTTVPWLVSGPYASEFFVQLDPNKPNEIKETRSWKETRKWKGGDVEHTVTVNFKRCR
jgi:hypothetical protein